MRYNVSDSLFVLVTTGCILTEYCVKVHAVFLIALLTTSLPHVPSFFLSLSTTYCGATQLSGENRMSQEALIAKSEMLIRKPVEEVFQAFIDPAITTHFWFTKST